MIDTMAWVMSPLQERVVRMRRTMTPIQIAVELGCTRSNVYRLLDRARDKMPASTYREMISGSRPLGLSPRELSVMVYVSQGYSNPEGAAELCITQAAFAQAVHYAVIKLKCVSVRQACFVLGQDPVFVQLTKETE